jgi:hypothetical protein
MGRALLLAGQMMRLRSRRQSSSSGICWMRFNLDSRQQTLARFQTETGWRRELRFGANRGLPNFLSRHPQSVRKARIGSKREARRDGTYATVNATRHNSRLTPEKTGGFVGIVPNSRDAIHRLSANDPREPSAAPEIVSNSVLARTPRCTRHGLAPSAMQIPISFVR